MDNRTLAALATALCMAATSSGAVTPEPAPRACVPAKGNARITAAVKEPATSVRVYYHARGTAEEYYEEMRPNAAGGGFWAMLPIPKHDTHGVIYRIQAMDAE